MLSAKFTDEGQQFIASQMPEPQLMVHDLQGIGDQDVTQKLEAIRQRLSHRKLSISSGEVMGLELSLLPLGKTRIHFDVDLLVADVQSLHILLSDLASAYAGNKNLAADPNWRFAHYLSIEAERNQKKQEQDKAYWQQRLVNLPLGPQLPLKLDPDSIQKPEFVRRTWILPHKQWQVLRDIAAAQQITPAMMLLTAYAETLSRWSSEQHFLINMPLFDRQTDHPSVEHAVADFTNLLLLECDCREPTDFLSRVKQLQQQFLKDVKHARYSAVNVQRDMVKQGLTQGVVAPVVFACNLGTPLLTEQCRSTLGSLHYMISQTPQVWLDHQIYEVEDGLLLAWDAVEELFPEPLLDDMFSAYTALLEWLSADPTHWQKVETLNLPEHQQKVRQESNASEAAQVDKLLHQGMFEIAQQTPERQALVWGEQSWSYAQLAEQALRIAAMLQDHGLQIAEPVAVTLPRGLQ